MICVIGDTHGDISRFSDKTVKKLGKNDFLVICGDFGFVWDGSDKEKAVLKKIGAKRFVTLFLAGSHDNYDLLEQYPEEAFHGGMARHICGNLYMLSPGGVFELNGVKAFAFGGGQAADLETRIENATWWEQEQPTDEQLRQGEAALEAAGNKVDYVFTHEPPATLAEFIEMSSGRRSALGRLNVYFDELKSRISFKMWFFGKLHKNKLIPPRYAAVFDEPYLITDDR